MDEPREVEPLKVSVVKVTETEEPAVFCAAQLVGGVKDTEVVFEFVKMVTAAAFEHFAVTLWV